MVLFYSSREITTFYLALSDYDAVKYTNKTFCTHRHMSVSEIIIINSFFLCRNTMIV